VRILGTVNAKAATSNFTFTTRINNCQFAEDAGPKSLRKTWSGEDMHRFDLNLVMPRNGDTLRKAPIFRSKDW